MLGTKGVEIMRIEDIVKLTKRYERLEQVSQSLEKKLNRLGEKTKENSEWIKKCVSCS